MSSKQEPFISIIKDTKHGRLSLHNTQDNTSVYIADWADYQKKIQQMDQVELLQFYQYLKRLIDMNRIEDSRSYTDANISVDADSTRKGTRGIPTPKIDATTESMSDSNPVVSKSHKHTKAPIYIGHRPLNIEAINRLQEDPQESRH